VQGELDHSHRQGHQLHHLCQYACLLGSELYVWNNTGDKVILRRADGSEGHLFLAAAFTASAAAVLKERPPPVRLTLTWDQGSETLGTILLGPNFADGIYFAPPGRPLAAWPRREHCGSGGGQTGWSGKLVPPHEVTLEHTGRQPVCVALDTCPEWPTPTWPTRLGPADIRFRLPSAACQPAGAEIAAASSSTNRCSFAATMVAA
jgi:hypothetical protein